MLSVAAGRADAELLAGFEAYVFAALRHDARRARAAADDRADGRALAAARDAADDRAYPGTRADLRHVVLRAAPAAHAALRVNVADVGLARREHFDDLRAEGLPVARARHLYLVEVELKERPAVRLAGPPHVREMTADDCARQVFRLDDLRREAVAALAHVGRESVLKLHEQDGVRRHGTRPADVVARACVAARAVRAAARRAVGDSDVPSAARRLARAGRVARRRAATRDAARRDVRVEARALVPGVVADLVALLVAVAVVFERAVGCDVRAVGAVVVLLAAEVRGRALK